MHRHQRSQLFAACLLAGVAAPAAAQDENVNIVMSWWGGEHRHVLQNQVVDLFEERHPNVRIERQTASFANYWERLAVQAAGGNPPTQMQMQDRYLAQFAVAGTTLLPLDRFVEDGTIDVSTVPEGVLAGGRFDGQLLMIPVGLSYRAFTYDPAVLDELGVQHPWTGMTWDDFAGLLEAIRDADTREDRWAGKNDCEEEAVYYAFLRSYGHEPYDDGQLGVGRDEIVAYFTYWMDLQDSGALAPPDVQIANDGNNAEDSLFSKGITVFQHFPGNQFAGAQQIVQTADMTPLPVGPAGLGDTLTLNAHSIAANATEEQALWAARYIDFFLNDEEANRIFNADNGIPTSSRARAVATSADSRYFELYEEIENDIRPFDPLPTGHGQIWDALSRTCEALQFGYIDIEEAADDFLNEAAAILRR